ncbi:MAG: hypothetical protein JO297_04270 [Nitrososphaeraceae archaeon]|nr:hypothetical protein [Nitrososphaeraceae archaeon]
MGAGASKAVGIGDLKDLTDNVNAKIKKILSFRTLDGEQKLLNLTIFYLKSILSGETISMLCSSFTYTKC